MSPRQLRRKVRKGNSLFTPLPPVVYGGYDTSYQSYIRELFCGPFAVTDGGRAVSANLYTVSTVSLGRIEGLVGAFDQ